MSVFFFNDTATTEIYTLSLHDALPISLHAHRWGGSLGLPLLDAVPQEQPRNRNQRRGIGEAVEERRGQKAPAAPTGGLGKGPQEGPGRGNRPPPRHTPQENAPPRPHPA